MGHHPTRAHNMCKPGLDPIDCKYSFYLKRQSILGSDSMNLNSMLLICIAIEDHLKTSYIALEVKTV